MFALTLDARNSGFASVDVDSTKSWNDRIDLFCMTLPLGNCLSASASTLQLAGKPSWPVSSCTVGRVQTLGFDRVLEANAFGVPRCMTARRWAKVLAGD